MELKHIWVLLGSFSFYSLFINLIKCQSVRLPETDERNFSDCFSKPMNASCDVNQVILVKNVEFGTKLNNGGCNVVVEDTDPDTCCQLEDTDCIYRDNSTQFYEHCGGRQQCDELYSNIRNVLNNQDTCDKSSHHLFTQYMRMDYFCIENERIWQMCDAVNSSHTDDKPIYILNKGYSSETTDSVTQCACSIETDACNETISIWIVHLEFSDSPVACGESITITGSDNSAILLCEENAGYNLGQRQTSSSYLTMSLNNTASQRVKKFWVGFQSDFGLYINCPATTQKYCLPSTTNATSTSTTTPSTNTSTTTPTTTTSTTTPSTTTSTTTPSTTTNTTTPTTTTSTTTQPTTSTTTTQPTTSTTTTPPTTTTTTTPSTTTSTTTPSTATNTTTPTTTTSTTIQPTTSTTTTPQTTTTTSTQPTTTTTITQPTTTITTTQPTTTTTTTPPTTTSTTAPSTTANTTTPTTTTTTTTPSTTTTTTTPSTTITTTTPPTTTTTSTQPTTTTTTTHPTTTTTTTPSTTTSTTTPSTTTSTTTPSTTTSTATPSTTTSTTTPSTITTTPAPSTTTTTTTPSTTTSTTTPPTTITTITPPTTTTTPTPSTTTSTTTPSTTTSTTTPSTTTTKATPSTISSTSPSTTSLSTSTSTTTPSTSASTITSSITTTASTSASTTFNSTFGTPSSAASTEEDSSSGYIVAILIGSLVAVSGLLVLWFCCRREQNGVVKPTGSEEGPPMEAEQENQKRPITPCGVTSEGDGLKVPRLVRRSTIGSGYNIMNTANQNGDEKHLNVKNGGLYDHTTATYNSHKHKRKQRTKKSKHERTLKARDKLATQFNSKNLKESSEPPEPESPKPDLVTKRLAPKGLYSVENNESSRNSESAASRHSVTNGGVPSGYSDVNWFPGLPTSQPHVHDHKAGHQTNSDISCTSTMTSGTLFPGDRTHKTLDITSIPDDSSEFEDGYPPLVEQAWSERSFELSGAQNQDSEGFRIKRIWLGVHLGDGQKPKNTDVNVSDV